MISVQVIQICYLTLLFNMNIRLNVTLSNYEKALKSYKTECKYIISKNSNGVNCLVYHDNAIRSDESLINKKRVKSLTWI
jgi:hypothetical protein